MKTFLANLITATRSALLAIFVVPLLLTYSQSERAVQRIGAKATQTLTPAATPLTQSNTKLVNGSPNKYQIIFAREYEGKTVTAGEQESRRGKRTRLTNFIEQLNKAGEQNYELYKLISPFPYYSVALVKLGEAKHEYTWFEMMSSSDLVKSRFAKSLQQMSEKGYRLIAHSLVSRDCDQTDSEFSVNVGMCTFTDLVLFAKQTGVKKFSGQTLVSPSSGREAKANIELKTQCEEKFAEGYWPVSILSAYEILFEKQSLPDNVFSDKPDVQIVRASWKSNDLEDKVNEWAKQGYRLAITRNRIAVMYRNKATVQIPVSYVWLQAAQKSLAKDLAQLGAKGAIYHTVYPTDQGTANILIFEQKLKDDGIRAEFKVLQFEFDERANQAEKKVYVDLNPTSKEAAKQMTELTKEGFEVRDLFYAEGVKVILERRK